MESPVVSSPPPPKQTKTKAKYGNNVVVGGVMKGKFGDLEEDIRERLKFGLQRNIMVWWEDWFLLGGT